MKGRHSIMLDAEGKNKSLLPGRYLFPVFAGLAVILLYPALASESALLPSLYYIVIFACLAFLRRPEPKAAPVSGAKIRMWTLYLLLTVAALGAFLRLYRISIIPPGLWVDEIYTATNARELFDGGRWASPARMTPLVGPGWVETSNFYLYFVRFIWLLFGRDYLGTKMISILPGAVAPVLLFYFVRNLWGSRAGLAAAFLIAVSSWQITLSRWGWDQVLLTSLQIPAATALIRGEKRGRSFNWALAGALAGLCLYTAAASRLIALFFFAYLSIESIIQKDYFRRNMRGMGLFVLFFAFTSAPLVWYFINQPSAFGARLSEVSIFSEVAPVNTLRALARNTGLHLGMFHFWGDPNVRHHLPGASLLDPLSGLFLLAGLAAALRDPRNSRFRFLLLWIGFGLLGGILSSSAEAPQAYRTCIVAPPVFALCGAGLLMILRFASRLWGIRSSRSRFYVLVALPLLLITAGINGNRYFVRYPRESRLYRDFWGAEQTAMARHLKAAEKAGEVILLDGAWASAWYFVHRSTVELVNGSLPPFYLPGDPMPLDAPGLMVYLPPFRRGIYDALLPGLPFEALRNPAGEIYALRAHLALHEIRRIRLMPPARLYPVRITWYGSGENPLSQDIAGDLNLSGFPPPADADSAIIGTRIFLPGDYCSLLEIRSRRTVRLFVDGTEVLTNRDGEKVVPLKAGEHVLKLEVEIEHSGSSQDNDLDVRLFWRPDFEHQEIIPGGFCLPPDTEG